MGLPRVVIHRNEQQGAKTNDVVEARYLLANFLVISDYIWHLNFTDCFGGEGLALDANNGLQTLFKYSFSLVTSHSDAFHQQKRA